MHGCGFNLELLICDLTGIRTPRTLQGCISANVWAPLARWSNSRDYLKRFWMYIWAESQIYADVRS